MATGAGHPRVRRRPRLGVVLATIVASLVLAGCGGGSEKQSDPSPSPAPSVSASASVSTPSATPAAEKVPRTPTATPGKAGQQRFARHVMDLWGYGLRTDNAKPIVALSPKAKPCRGCTEFTATLTRRHKQGWSVDFAGVKVRKVVLKQVAGNTYARSTVDIAKSDSYNTDGTFRNTNKKHDGATFEVLMSYARKKYHLLAFTVS